MINRTLRATVRCAALAVLLCCFSATHAQDETYYGGNLDDVVISDERAQDLARQLLDVDALLHALSAKAIANDDRLVDFVEGFMERNGIGVLTISYVDSDDLWPKILKKGSLKKIQKAPDATLVAGILFFPEENVDSDKRSFTARLVLEGKTNEVYDLLNISGDDMALISEDTSDELIGAQSYSKPRDAQDKVVNAMIAALQKVEQNADPEGPTGQVVTFRKKGNQKHGFDLQTYDQLQADYPTIVVGGESYPTAWKSLKTTQPDEVIAIDTSGQEVAFELDGVPVNGNLTNGRYTLSLQGSSDGTEGELLAKVGETTVGKLNTVSYNLSSIDLKIVPVNGAGSGISQTALQSALDSTYAPAVASWNVQVLDNQELGNAWDPEGDGLDDGETGSFTNYTDEMNDLIKAFKSQNDRDKDAYYIFLVDRAENASKLGYMPRKKQWGFVFTNGQSTESLTKTIAHELGHGVYRLEHPFSEKGLPKGQTDNLMDYSNGEELYKYQWDYVHDPASVVTLFDDEEEGAYVAMSEEEFDYFFAEVEPIMNGENSEVKATIKKLKEIYEIFEKCNDENWASYNGQGVIPYCFWRDAESGDLPFTAGIVDGAYLEYEAITQLVPMIEDLHDNISKVIAAYTIDSWRCRDEAFVSNSTEYERVLYRLKELEGESSVWSWVEERWQEDSKQDLEEFYKECEEVQTLKNDINEIYVFITDFEEVIDLYFEIESKITEYLETLQSDGNEGYYERGRLVIPAATVLIDGVGVLSKMPRVKKALQGMKKIINDGEWTRFTRKVDELAGSSVDDLISALNSSMKSTYDDLIASGLSSEIKAHSILMKNANGETVAIINNNKLTPTKWDWQKDFPETAKTYTSEGYIIIKQGDEIRFDLGFKEGRKLEAKEVNDYLVNGQGKDLDGQPYWAGSEVEEIVLGRQGEIIYFIENNNEGLANPGFYASKDPISTLKELREKLAVKKEWKPDNRAPTLRTYKVKSEFRVRSGIVGRQVEKGVELPGGGHQYEVVDYRYNGSNWQSFFEEIGPKGGIRLE